MSAKHILVPPYFEPHDFSPERLRAVLSKFHRMTTEERNALASAGRIERIAPKLWRWCERDITGPSIECGKGMISLEILDRRSEDPWWLFDAIQAALHGQSACG